MSFKIIIERRFKEPPVIRNLRAIEGLRMHAMQQKGYISGETLINSEDSCEVVVLSTWADFDSFNTWSSSKERAGLEEELTPYMESPARISSFSLGADAIDEMFDKIIHDSEIKS